MALLGPGERVLAGEEYDGMVDAALSCASRPFADRLATFGLMAPGYFDQVPNPAEMTVAQIAGGYRTSFRFKAVTERGAREAQQQIGLAAFDAGVSPVNVGVSRYVPVPGVTGSGGGGTGVLDRAGTALGTAASGLGSTVREVARLPLYLAIAGVVGLVIYYTAVRS